MNDKTTQPEPNPEPVRESVGGCQQDAGSRLKVFPSDHVFGLIKPCPCCGGNLSFRATGWEDDADGLWMATDGELQCSNEPDIDTEEWNSWCWDHFDSDYGERWHARLEMILADAKKKIRFKDDSENAEPIDRPS
jgi:hypothetical protein